MMINIEDFKKFIFQKNLVIFLCAIFNHNFFISKTEIEENHNKCFVCSEFKKLHLMEKPDFRKVDYTSYDVDREFNSNQYLLYIIFKCKENSFPVYIIEQLQFLKEQHQFEGPSLDKDNHWWWLVIRKTFDLFFEKDKVYGEMGFCYLDKLIKNFNINTNNSIYSISFKKFIKPTSGGGFSDIVKENFKKLIHNKRVGLYT